MKAYHITQWDSLYETSETRKIRALTFYAKPNKLIGLGIGRTLQHARGLELLGVWALLEALASLAPQGQRGWLVRNGQALTVSEIAYLLRIPEESVQVAMDHFSQPEIGWLEQAEVAEKREITSGPSGDSPGETPDEENEREDAGTISLRGKRKDKRGKTDLIQKKKEKGGFASDAEMRAAQKAQFAAANGRLEALMKISDDDLTEEDRQEIKKMRRTVQDIQKKQAAGDFTPVEAAA